MLGSCCCCCCRQWALCDCCSINDDDVVVDVKDAPEDGQSNITTCDSIALLGNGNNGLITAAMGRFRHGLRAARLKSVGDKILRAFLKVE